MEEHVIEVNAESSALLVVDMQPDFMPGGALAVMNGHDIVAPIDRMMRSSRFGVIAATQDWHPPGHVSFASAHPGRKSFETIELHGREQILWPDHCVQNSPGAELSAGLPWDRVAVIVRKGADPEVDSYSGIRNNWNRAGLRPSTGLAGYLKDRAVIDVFLCGLARDYCVKWTAEDAAAEGFRVHFLWDLTRAVDPASDNRVREDLSRAGVAILQGK
jgi:nicotinamidase/pyrazinamidase